MNEPKEKTLELVDKLGIKLVAEERELLDKQLLKVSNRFV